MFPLLHDRRRRGAQVQPIDQTRREDRHDGYEDAAAAGFGEESAEPRGCGETGEGRAGARAGVGEGEEHGQRRLQTEVDGEDGGLETGELGPRQAAVGDDAVDESLVDGGAQEGSVAGVDVSWGCGGTGGGDNYARMW